MAEEAVVQTQKQKQKEEPSEEKEPSPAPTKKRAERIVDHAQKYWQALLGKRVKITPMIAGLPPITGTLMSFGIYEVEIELQNRTVYVMKHAIYTIEEAPEPIIGVKKR